MNLYCGSTFFWILVAAFVSFGRFGFFEEDKDEVDGGDGDGGGDIVNESLLDIC